MSEYKEKSFCGWRVIDKSPAISQCVICVAPHTSNWDFIVGYIAAKKLGRSMHFLMKKDWFIWPLGHLFRKLGGIPVDRSENTGLTDQLIATLKQNTKYTLVITPEGTRSANSNWKRGFYYIAQLANVPILLAYIDYEQKEIGISEPFKTTNNIEEDINKIKQFFTNYKGKHPEQFAI